MRKSLLIVILIFYFNFCYSQQYWQVPNGIREIPAPYLNDIASASFDQSGPVIYYNPNVVQQVGPLVTAFFEAHEYGHHFLGHVTARLFNPNNPFIQNWLSQNAENEADEYSIKYHTRNGNKIVLQAAYSQFINFPNNGDATHPPSVFRAQHILDVYYQLTGTNLFP